MSTPAVEIRSFAVSIAANTPASSPQITQINFPPRVVTEIHWRVPPGPVGLMGWKLTMSNGQAVLPTNGQFIITDDDKDTWPVVNQPDGGFWEVTGYNTDIYPHIVYLDFFLSLVGEQNAATQLMPNSVLSSPPPITTPLFVTTPITTPAPVTTPQPVSVPGG